MEKIIEIKNLFFSYEEALILEDISIDIMKNDFIVFIGPNGGGKTTLLRLLLGFIKPDKGSIAIFSKNPVQARIKMGYVPQYSEFDKEFPITVIDVVLGGLLKTTSFFPRFKKEEKEKAEEIMKKLEILPFGKKRFGELSGGQKQRVLIARALVSSPEILILDEPTASVDPTVEKEVYEILKDLNKDLTVILVSHDIGFVSSYVSRVGCLNKRLVVHHSEEISKISMTGFYERSVHILQHTCHL
ncbi:MAG TPA: hypothetical protein DHW82_08505 [Spirochaetia bacterium]|nr:MAG: hypothetical protein A2Y41_13160 [Spirochaetes bacterium GWB1_36_13]HCL57030.1 hypothetical protein [Spirochaetia bacterium]